MLLTALTVLSNLVLLYTRAYASALRVGEILVTAERVRNPVQDEYMGSASNGLFSFEKVDFAYPNSGVLLFDDLSFSLLG